MTAQVYVGRNVAVAFDQYDMSGNGNELKAKRDAATIDATVFGDRFSYDLAGIQKASIELKGFYTPGYNNIDGIVNQRFGQDSDVLAAYGALGWPLGGPMVMQPSVITKYDIDAKLKGAVTIDCTMMARGYVDDGYILLSPNQFTTATGTSTALDNTPNGGATVAGANAQLHVFSVTGTTPSLTMKLQGSPDGTTWTDIPGMLFSAATTASAQRLVLPKQQTIPAQVRANWTISGTTPSFLALLGFARGVVYS